jgi:UPF0271 protein
MEKYWVDINCDLGEGFPDDASLMPYISSANIACGAHAGSDLVMQQTIQLAITAGVKIGAHPGFNDPQNFGRKEQHLSDSELTDLIQSQVVRLQKIVQSFGVALHHVKPHGALYNMSAASPNIARVIVKAIKEIDASLCLYGLSNSHSIEQATAIGVNCCNEVFADRCYRADGTLLPRSHPLALITNPEEGCRQVAQMVLHQSVLADSGIAIPVLAETICIHGDAPGAAAMAAHIFHYLQLHNIGLQKN